MNENASNAGGTFSGLAMKALAVVVLLVAAWILFKVVIGVVAAVAWIVVVVLGIFAVLWALSVLRRYRRLHHGVARPDVLLRPVGRGHREDQGQLVLPLVPGRL